MSTLIPQLNKQQLILRDIVCEYMDEYRNRQSELMANWRHYNVENLVEEAMCRVGGYQFVDEHHYDNSDYSDTKTATISRAISKTTGSCTYKVNVGGVVSDAGVPKAGDLRVVVHNPIYERLDYYFMPKAGWEHIREYGAANQDKLRSNYNPDMDVIHKWPREWRCESFKDLASRPATVTAPNVFTPQPLNMFSELFEWVVEEDEDSYILLD